MGQDTKIFNLTTYVIEGYSVYINQNDTNIKRQSSIYFNVATVQINFETFTVLGMHIHIQLTSSFPHHTL